MKKKALLFEKRSKNFYLFGAGGTFHMHANG